VGKIRRPQLGIIGRPLTLIELAPLRLRPLQRQPRQRPELVAGVFEQLRQPKLQLARTLGQHDAELGHQATDAADAFVAIFLDALAQPVHAQHALLLDRLDRHEAHGGTAGRLADRGRVVGVVLAR
jgi:hypothetical protein